MKNVKNRLESEMESFDDWEVVAFDQELLQLAHKKYNLNITVNEDPVEGWYYVYMYESDDKKKSLLEELESNDIIGHASELTEDSVVDTITREFAY